MTGIITNMVMPKIEREAEARNYGKFVISPLEGGYGVTLGNALRRVLLSSLEGTAITSVRFADVLHEFSDIPGVREDVTDIVLNLKQVRLAMTSVVHYSVAGPVIGMARGGLDVPWEVTVTRQGGFDGPITLALDGGYLDIYETQAFHPEPSAGMRDGGTLFLEFDPPPSGEVFVVSYDAYIQPGSQVGSTATLAVVDQGVQVAPVVFSTRLLP